MVEGLGTFQFEYRFKSSSGYEPAEPAKVNIYIEEPAGLDKSAYDALQSCQETLKNSRDTIGKCYKELLTLYPASVYTAWALTTAIAAPENIEPTTVKNMINEDVFPSSNSVPDANSDDGWISIPEGKPMAEWQVQWADKILKDHGDFPLADGLSLNLGVNYLVLGKSDLGLEWLKKVAEKDNKAGQWAKDFLAIWQ